MKRFLVPLAIVVLSLSLNACTTAERKDTGMVAGGVVGGVAGSALTRGSPAGAIAGAVVGAYVGRALTN